MSKTLEKGFAEMRDFQAVLGRLSFAVGALDKCASLYGTPLRLGSSSGYQGYGEAALVSFFLAAVRCGQYRRGGRACVVKPRGAHLGPAFMADAKAEGQHVCVGGWECLGGCPRGKHGGSRWS